jgi:hypothetical protein
MKKRESASFGIAFLDLLSGALGAVIILFIVIPKGADPISKLKIDEPKQAILSEEFLKDIGKKADLIEKFKNQRIDENSKINQKNIEIKYLLAKVDDLAKDNRKLSHKVNNALPELKKKKAKIKKVASIPADVGFQFKGKKILFLIDVSASMKIDDKIGQVKAGLKMLVTSMTPNFKIDIIYFPGPRGLPFMPLWGKLNIMKKNNKRGVYSFLHNLKANGFTPTRATLDYALKHYSNLSDIVLLSDGEPTITDKQGNQRIDNIYDVIKQTTWRNGHRVQINTIGVGEDFVRGDKTKKYDFLKVLSERNGGFFVGF